MASVIGERAETLSAAEITHLTQDSRDVSPGTVFIAIRGRSADGHDFVGQVLEKGASAVVVDAAFPRAAIEENMKNFPGAQFVQVENTRKAREILSLAFYRDPSQRLLCIGVTGTNGKTSITYILEHLLSHSRLQVGVIGTIDHHLGSKRWPTRHTTPDPITLQKRLFEMREEGAQVVTLEVSSHALDQGRIDGVRFNVVIFTNLTHDHLDYHRSMEDYFAAKQKLFTDHLWQSNKIPLFAIINTDDPWGRKLRVAGKAGLWTIGKNEKGRSRPADFLFSVKEMNFSGCHLSLETPFGPFEGEIPLCGIHNVYNVVSAIAAVATLGISPEQSLKAVRSFPGVPGRLQRVPGASKHVFIDYAHTPDALEKVLKTLVEIHANTSRLGQLITVFGCGGDRDAAKRPLMAQVAERWSDHVIVTSDNPRSEDPDKIIEEIHRGFSAEHRHKVHREPDRRKAIALALQLCRPGDVVLIAGKGHEEYQEVGREKFPFSDAQVARELLL